MVERVLSLLHKEIKGLHEAAYILGAFSLLAQILGLFRDRLFAGTIGPGLELDIYYAAFRIPDFIFVTVSSLVSVSVLVPFITNRLEKKEELHRFLRSIWTVFGAIIILVSVIVFFIMPDLLSWTMPKLYNSPLGGELLWLSRFLLISPIVLGISSFLGSVAQAYRRFLSYVISPILYNLGIIIGIVFWYKDFGVIGLGYGVALGAVFHALILLPSIFRLGLASAFIPTFSLKNILGATKDVVSISLPRTLALGASQIAFFVLIVIASGLALGSISIFSFAFNLQSVPMTIVGASYSLAAFPTLSRFIRDGMRSEFVAHIGNAVRHIVFWSAPVTILFIVLRAHIVRVVLGTGIFDWQDTRLVAACLAIFAVSVVAQNIVLLFSRGFYSAGKTKEPLLANAISSIFIIVIAPILTTLYLSNDSFRQILSDLLRVGDLKNTEILILPLAFSMGMIINALLLWFIFERNFSGVSAALIKPFTHTIIASLALGVSTYIALNLTQSFFGLSNVFSVFAHGLVSGTIGLIVWAIVLWLLRNEEILEVSKTIFIKKIGIKPVSDQTVE